MRGRVIAGVLTPILVLAGAAGYLAADAADLVPGWITTSPEPVAPAPFLTAEPVEASAAPGTELAPLFDPGAPLPDAARIQALAQALRDDPRTGPSTNVSVIDLITGQTLADLDADDGQVPASTTKLLTTIGVVAKLGPDHRLSTVARYDAARGEVALVAGGDMLLAADKGVPKTPDPGDTRTAAERAVGYAGLGDLADQVAAGLIQRGVTSVTVVADTSAFPGPAYPIEWPAYALQQGYAAPVTGLAIDVGKKNLDEEYPQRWADPAANAADEFAARLAERGITATRGKARVGATGDDVGRVESAPLSDVVAYMLHHSDNTVAEDLSRVLAIETGVPATPQHSMAAITASLVALGVDTSGLQLYDGAGFSTRNRIPPRVLTQAIRAAVQAGPTHDLLGWLAEAGLTGTLQNRFTSSPGTGVVRAKTGSLTGVTALAGVVITADGRPLAFAALIDGMPYGPERPQAAIDEFADGLAQCGCQP
ncbi:D-alanyl-D-alanine carboxypeptidase/D-alanyl-D-alanine endopeptidase [Demequina lutea]|uniref:D-alanyl-D-alanine carboxypeptidase/D-alanyl-D-alanine-endopeptidase (Penicillin-binding protein 4) n=1 Tax=Demequina lutea TaxID=431489 RepID=A0A7Y9ZA39_9MICO|nr:D-alanyl-D-alanine carboxypeptidase/D-alanyl-D-alanine-endopeptidase [Demequina lutea]NYI40463.1 D-alanyl-D-alanine carboxypeptidase/D-alanyl-D-alanine-endopeptidase (penicillin-binding protein 4) [Demequina lutea]